MKSVGLLNLCNHLLAEIAVDESLIVIHIVECERNTDNCEITAFSKCCRCVESAKEDVKCAFLKLGELLGCGSESACHVDGDIELSSGDFLQSLLEIEKSLLMG